METDPNKQYLWWMITCVTIGVTLFIFHSFKLIQHSEYLKSTPLLSVLSLLLILFGIIGIVVFIASIHTTSDHIFCVFAAHWGPSGYSIFKFILYCILVLRFIATFRNSVVAYSQKKLNIWLVILFLWTSGNLVGINMTAKNIPGTCEVEKPPLPMIASIALIGTQSVSPCTYNCTDSEMNIPPKIDENYQT